MANDAVLQSDDGAARKTGADVVPAPPALPSSLRRLFWEYDFDTLTWERDRDLVIARVLAHGNWRDTCWLLDRIGDDGVRRYLLRTHGRGLSRPQLRYWETILELPHEQVTAWMSEPGRRIWDER